MLMVNFRKIKKKKNRRLQKGGREIRNSCKLQFILFSENKRKRLKVINIFGR